GQILGALDEAHDKGVIHRDLKPENVMLLDVRGESDFVKVCDFGIAKVASERDGEGSAITMAGMVCGTPEYMSPEQARGDSLDGRSDLYATAVILYQMVAGDVPFRAESALGVITKHLTEEPTPPSKRRNGSVSPALEAVILRGLAKNKEDRFASAAEMRAALFDALGIKRPSSSTNQRVSGAVAADAWAVTGVATPASTPAQAATRPAAASHPSVHGELAAQPAGKKRAGVIAAAFALTAGLAGGAWVVLGKKGDAATAELPPAHVEAKTAPSPIEAPRPAPPTPPPPIAQPVAAPIPPPPPAGAPTPPTVLAPTAHPHKKHDPRAASSAAMKAAVAAPTAAAAAPPDVPTPPRPSTAPKGALAEGQALLRGGDVEGALAKFQEAARANPSDARAQKEIGKCYNRLGQRDRAQPYLKKYLELAPDASDAAFIRAMIEQK
ncbi:MAG: protein kinase domain-containing protein, partial [Polyangia bacterium]